jgi:DNA primase
MIKEKYIDIAKSRVDIIQLVEDLCPEVSLKNDGQHKKKCCSFFHEESTPSLKFNSTLNRYKCFGCGRSGDVIQFVEDYSGLDFQGAVRYLLDTYCPIWICMTSTRRMTPEKEQEYRKAETMYIYNDLAYQFFRAQYEADNEEASNCRKYAEYSR